MNLDDDAHSYAETIANASTCRMSVVNALESIIVLESHGGVAAGEAFFAFIASAAIRLEPVESTQLMAAIRAWRRFGKGNHPAALNFGDCFAYALAEVSGFPLLYKGTDFSRTDIRSALENS